MYTEGVLVQTITDVATPTNTFTISYNIDIPTTLGGNQAWVGFGAGNGGLNAQHDILSWRWAEAPPPVTGDPSNLTATATNSGRIRVGWTDGSENEVGYIVERSTGGGAFTEIFRGTNPAATSYFDTTVTPGTTYSYRV